jgi:hypothetical protein
MAKTVTELADASGLARRRRGEISVRVWRHVGMMPQELFTFAGAVNAVALAAVLQHVRRLTCELPGHWRIEVIATGLDRGLLHAVVVALRELRRNGQHAELLLAPRLRPTLPAWLAHQALALLAPTLTH